MLGSYNGLELAPFFLKTPKIRETVLKGIGKYAECCKCAVPKFANVIVSVFS